jgi:hypothetical protein
MRKLLKLLATFPLLVCLTGCPSVKVDQTRVAPMNAPKPDAVVVYDFDVSPAEVKLDRGLVPQISRETGGKTQTEEEEKLGRLVADALTHRLVDALDKAGITAHRAADNPTITPDTLQIKGYFLRVDQGDQNMRVVVGFGLGGSQVRTHALAIQNNKLVAEGYTKTDSGLKPGMGLSVAGGATSVAISAGSAGVSEAVLNTVQADARRTADKIASKIVDAYKKRGWLPSESPRLWH